MNFTLPTKDFKYIVTGVPVVLSQLDDLSKTFSKDSINYVIENESQQQAEKWLIFALTLIKERSRQNMLTKKWK